MLSSLESEIIKMTKNKMKCAGAACLSALLFVDVPLASISMKELFKQWIDDNFDYHSNK